MFAPTQHVTILLLPPRAGLPQQRFPSRDGAISDSFQAWLRHLNARGYNIYFGTNPINPARQRREKQDIAELRHVQIDLDDDGPGSLQRIQAAARPGTLPHPAAVIHSSAARYQVLWLLAAGWTPAEAEDVNRRLALRYNGDRAATDCSRVFRLPGFRNRKPARGDAWVTWTGYPEVVAAVGDFAVLPAREDSPAEAIAVFHEEPDRAPAEELGRRPAGAAVSQSERDWAWWLEALRRGQDPAIVRARLQQRRADDKPNPEYYARRTVERAAASLAREIPAQEIER